jgi:hypothetical protein
MYAKDTFELIQQYFFDKPVKKYRRLAQLRVMNKRVTLILIYL